MRAQSSINGRVEQTNETEFLVLPALNLPTEDDVDLLFQCKSCPVDFYQQVCYSLWVTCCGCKTFCWLKCSWKLSTSVFTSNFDSKHIYHCVCGPTTCRQLLCVCACVNGSGGNTLASLVSVISHCTAWLRSCVLMWLYAQKMSVSCNHLFIRFLNELVGLLFSLFKLRAVSSLFLIKRNLNEILLLVNKKVTENIWWQEFGNRKNFPQEKKLRD